MTTDNLPLSALFTTPAHAYEPKAKWQLVDDALHFQDYLTFNVVAKYGDLICQIINYLDLADDFPNKPDRECIGLAFLSLDELKGKIAYERERLARLQTSFTGTTGVSPGVSSDDAAASGKKSGVGKRPSRPPHRPKNVARPD